MAFMFAPSMYTRPPISWMRAAMCLKPVSKIPEVFGLVHITPAMRGPNSAIFASRSIASTSPLGAAFTMTMPYCTPSTLRTSKPAVAAVAKFVPCELFGMRMMLRSGSPRSRW